MEDLNTFLNISDKQKEFILNNIIISDINFSYKIDITSNVYNDINIDNWINNLPSLKGSKILINNLIKNPINNIDLLINRQNSIINLDNKSIDLLKEYEDNVLWIYTLNDEIDKDLSINLLYPSTYLINKLNYYKLFLDIYHPYKIFFLPFMSLFYPISILFTPLFYMKKYLKSDITIMAYLNILFLFLKFFFKNTGNIRKDIIKLITFFIYIGLYIYSIYQTFELSYLIYKTKSKLIEKMNGLCLFINKSVNIINSININNWYPFYLYNNLNYNPKFKINNTMSDIYKLWKNDDLKNQITTILKIIYTIDIVNSINLLKKSNNWCCPIYDNNINTKLWNMKNPLLSDNQQKNPIDLSKNIIITGPNAAGKTTYIKTIITNIVLSQTIGIVNAIKADTNIYDSIHSFMRINDILGSKSYFEAETECCSNMIKKALEIQKNNQKALLFMDEPMHSTPPTEGISVAFAVAEYLSKLNGIKLIITTHYHKLINLENKYPDLFINLCVNAFFDKNLNKYLFNYKITKGFSNQCIAIELLEKQKFPKEVIDSAIYLKNKICTKDIVYYDNTIF